MNSPAISIIVPVYNSESTLSRCIDSILSQNYLNFELLLVNDGSRDKSKQICEQYALKDSRIKVFNKENGGVSSARNMGLDNAQGEWVTFVDSDDWVKEGYLKNLLSHTSDEIDLVISYAEVFTHGVSEFESYPSHFINAENFELMFIDNDMHWHTSPWSKLYRMSVIRNNKITFCEGMHIGEDAYFLYKFMLNVDNIYISSDTDYCYYKMMEGSLTKRVNSLSSELLSYRNIACIVNMIFQSRNIQSPKAINNLNWIVATYIRRVINALYYHKVERKTRIKILKELKLDIYLNHIRYDFLRQRLFDNLLRLKQYWLYDFIKKIK